MDQISRLDHGKLIKIFAGMVATSVVWCMVMYPKITKMAVVHQSKLKPGAKNREKVYLNIPFELDFRLNLFNVTNPEEVMQGGTPILQEVGPYFFSEWKKKYDEVDNDDDDSLEFNLKNTFYFRPDLTAPLTGNEIINFPNPILMGAMVKTKMENEGMLELVTKGMNLVFNNPTSPFLRETAWNIMFGGFPLNCESTEFEGQAVCGAIQNELDGQLEALNDTHFSYALFRGSNGTSAGRFKVKRGMKNIKELNNMMEYNEETEQDVWDGEHCNELRGTDGLMFSPFKKKKDKIAAFSYALCRTIDLHYVKHTRYKGVGLHQFTTSFPDLRNDPEKQCFCQDPPDGCPPEGMLDLGPCVGAPLFGSKPHFLEVDPKVQELVKGLNPDPKEHQLTVDFELMAGNPLHAIQRMQISLSLIPVEEYPIMANMPTLYLPLFWLEEGISVTGELLFMIRLSHIGDGFNALMKWGCLLVGLPGCAVSGYFLANSGVVSTIEVKTVEPVSQETSAGVVKSINNFGSKFMPEIPQNPNASDTVDVAKFRKDIQ